MGRDYRGRLAIYSGIVAIAIACAFAGQIGMIFLALAITGRSAYELYGSMRIPSAAFRTSVCTGYVLLGIALLSFAIVVSPWAGVFTFIVIAAFEVYPLAAVVAAIFLRGLAGFGLLPAIAVCAAFLMAALLERAAVSWIKRRSGIEYFGNLSRHGGVLDWFASLLFAAPVALFFFRS